MRRAWMDELTEALRSKLHVLNRFNSWKTFSYKRRACRAYRRCGRNTDFRAGWADECGVRARGGDDAADPAWGRRSGVRMADYRGDLSVADDRVLQLPADDCGVST